MTKENTIKLYKHFKSIAENVKKDRGNKDFKPIVRENARKHAEEIETGHPYVLVKEEVIKPKGKK